MVNTKINRREFDQLIDGVKKATRADVLLPAAERVAERLKDLPAKKPGAFSSMATPGQKRAVWAKAKANPGSFGSGGYIRSGTLAAGWEARKVNQYAVRVQNKAPHAVWVYGDSTQQPFHRASGFPKESEVAGKYRRTITRNLNNQVKEALK